jgi:hypothetical protein
VGHEEKESVSDSSVTPEENADVETGAVAAVGGVGGGGKKKQNRDYCVTKSTLLTEMKVMAKYDRKVLEMGSKAFMSFLKVP